MDAALTRARLRVAHQRALLWLVLGNAAVLVADGYGYIVASDPPRSVAGWLFAHAALVAQLGTGALALGVVFLALASVGAGYRLVAVVAPVVFAALQLALYLDRKVYALFRYHVNGLVLSMVTTRAGWESMQFGGREVALAPAILGGLIAVEVVAYRVLLRRFLGVATPRRPPLRSWAVAVAAVLALGVAEHLEYAIADLANARDVIGLAKVVPLYQPLTLRRFVRHVAGIRVDKEVKLAVRAEAAYLHYPRAPLRFHDPARRPSILWIVLDGWRADTFTPDNTPEIWRLGTSSQVFARHVSGGNGTRYGIFSMFYGLHGSYWSRVVAERTGPVLLKRLRELGYRFRILSSTPLEYGEFRRTVFVDLPEAITDRVPGPVAERDRMLADDVASFAVDPDPRPSFAFLFLDSTHAPYDFPAEFERYRPSSGFFDYKDVAPERRTELFNRYRNAVLYDDHLVGELLRRLGAAGRLDDTVVLVTGDHGEECWEHGHWGHNAAFTPEQIRVPLVLHVPGLAPAVHRGLTGHQDLAATFLEMAGVENPPGDYSQGQSLLGATTDPFLVSCGWNQCALVDDAGVVVFGTESYNARGLDVLDADYRAVGDRAGVLRERSPKLATLMAQMSAFLR